MALVSESQKSNSLFSPRKSNLNLRKSSTQDFQDILKSLNIKYLRNAGDRGYKYSPETAQF